MYTPDVFWKNFRLGTELQVSGIFIYNALKAFDEMESFYYEEQVFEFLYGSAVGLERILKIVIVLLEHTEITNQEIFEKTLITHNHLDLLKRVRKQKGMELGKTHTKFLRLLSEFYQSVRYSRYNLASVYKPDQSREKLSQFLEDALKIEINAELLNVTPNDQKIKNFIGKVTGKIVTQLYEIIREEANKQRLATYEIPYGSKAFKIFIAQEFTFEKERLLQKELLLYLMKVRTGDRFQTHIESLEPMPFGYRKTNHYVKYVLSIEKAVDVIDEFTHLNEELPFDKKRGEAVDLIGGDFDFEHEGFLDNEDNH